MKKELNDWHFARPELARKYLELFKLGLTSARSLFARRRMGKTEFLKKDLIPAAEAQGYIAVYVNLWDLESDPATAIIYEFYKTISPKGFKKIFSAIRNPVTKIKASGKILGVGKGSIETKLGSATKKIKCSLLMDAMMAFDKTKKTLLLVIDEAQVLAYETNAKFSHALRAALDIRKERIKVVFAGSSETTLRKMFGVASEPFYNWAPLEPFELLGEDFVVAMVERVNIICKFPLSKRDALNAFKELKNTPEFFRCFIEYYLIHPQTGADAVLELTKATVFSEHSFKRQWDVLLPADKVILKMLSDGVMDLHSKTAAQRLGKELGVDDSVNKNTAQNALRRLMNKNIITKLEHGLYQFEDEAFLDWVKHND